MKKLFKAITCLSVACAVTASAAALAACGDDKDDDKGGNQTPATVSYQCLGYTDELASSFSSFDFMGNLLSDGTGTIYRYEHTGSTPEKTPVTWKVEKDRDGLTMLTLDDDIEDPFEVYMDDETKTFELEYRFAFAGSYHRNVKLTVEEKVTYNTVDEFKKAADERRKNIKPSTPDPGKKEAVVTFAGGEGNSIEFYADNTAVLSAFGGQMKFNYTWAIAEDVITLTSKDNPSETMVSVKEDNTYKFSYSASFLQGQTLTFTCNDISKLTAKTAVVTFAGGEGNSIVFYADNTAVLSAFGGQMKFNYTWAIAEDVITLTSKDNPSETMVSVKEDNTYKFSYSASFLQGQTLTFTCDDISALK